MTVLSLWVPGVPITQGSKKAFVMGGRAVIVDADSKNLKPWRAAIHDQGLRALEQRRIIDPDEPRPPFVKPVAVTLAFYLPRPKSHYRTGKNAHQLRPDAPTHPTNKQDVDKLMRAVLDSLTTSGIYTDDGLVVRAAQSKDYADSPDQCGVSVVITDHLPGSRTP